MQTVMLGLLAETAIHPGAGRSMGVVDLPVAREAATDYPVVVGSSLKGALSDKTERESEGDVERLFGQPNHAGELLVADGRILLLPVRSLTGSYRWVTCRHVIERYARDLIRAGLPFRPAIPRVAAGEVLTADSGRLFLEERQFEVAGGLPDGLVEAIGPLILHSSTRGRLGTQIAVLSDDDFTWFARYGLCIQARNKLNEETKKSEQLWYEETLPPDTLMYTLVMGRTAEALSVLRELVKTTNPYLQTGGNETVGQGWFAVSVVEVRRENH